MFGENDIDIYFSGGFSDFGSSVEVAGLKSLLSNPRLVSIIRLLTFNDRYNFRICTLTRRSHAVHMQYTALH